jgi:hypothetical protein
MVAIGLALLAPSFTGCTRSAEWSENIYVQVSPDVKVHRRVAYAPGFDWAGGFGWAGGPETMTFHAPSTIRGVVWKSPDRLRTPRSVFLRDGELSVLSAGNECDYGSLTPFWLYETWTDGIWRRRPLRDIPVSARRNLWTHPSGPDASPGANVILIGPPMRPGGPTDVLDLSFNPCSHLNPQGRGIANGNRD